MSVQGSNPPFNPEELQKELQSLLKGKFGADAKVEIYAQPVVKAAPAEAPSEAPSESAEGDAEDPLKFEYLPKAIKEHLDRFVIGQDEAKIVLSTVICDHYNHIRECAKQGGLCTDYAKQNVIMVGPTGIGKTYLIRNVAKLIGVPFVKADATKFSETGYVGADVDDLARELVHRANGDVRLAEYGIIYLDEVDKIATDPNLLGRDVSGRGVQFGLLKLLEETEVPLRSPMDIQAQLQAMMEWQQGKKSRPQTINTRHVLFLVSGAFTGLENVIRRRVGDQRVGFTTEVHGDEVEDYLRMAQPVDFVEFGFEPEFIGRFPVSVVCHDLSVQNLFDVMKYSEGSIIRQVEQAFRAYGIDIAFTDGALYRIAGEAHRARTGARGLVSVIERTLRHFKFELPSSGIKRLVIAEKTVDAPLEELTVVLKDPKVSERPFVREHVRRCERDFGQAQGIRIRFDEDALDAAAERCLAEGKDPETFCKELLKDYEFGLALVRKNTGQTEFILTRDVVERPTETLDVWIRESVDAKRANG